MAKKLNFDILVNRKTLFRSCINLRYIHLDFDFKKDTSINFSMVSDHTLTDVHSFLPSPLSDIPLNNTLPNRNARTEPLAVPV